MLMTSERLNFRFLELSDLEVFHQHRSDPEVMRFIRAPMKDQDETLTFMKTYIDYNQKFPGHGFMVVTSKESGEFVGLAVCIHLEFNPENTRKEIGYSVAPKFWGQGYASEMAQTLLDYGFYELKLDDIYGTTDTQNLVSQAVLKKTGFKQTGLGPYRDKICTLFHFPKPAKFLYWFQHEDFDLVEIKRLDIKSDRPSDLYYWLKINSDQTVSRLTFISMDEGIREFKEAVLNFQTSKVSFLEGESNLFLQMRNCDDVSAPIRQVVTKFIASL